MPLTLSNVEWRICCDLRDALATAEHDGSAAFAAVCVLADPAELAGRGQTASPVAAIVYVGGEEDDGPERTRGCVLRLELHLAAGAGDDATRLERILAAKNLAVNAIEATPPSDAAGWADGNAFHLPLRWGKGQLDQRARPPWARLRLPLTVAYVLSEPTDH